MKTHRATITQYDDSGNVSGSETVEAFEPETVEELADLLDSDFDGAVADLEQFGAYTPDFAE